MVSSDGGVKNAVDSVRDLWMDEKKRRVNMFEFDNKLMIKEFSDAWILVIW